MLKNNDLSIEFTMDKDINKMIMKLVDENTDETIKQFPPEIAIKIAKIVASTLGNGQLTDAKI
jgi:flagellar protein FlaG